MNWNKDKSVKLSKFCVCLFMLILAGVCIGAPWLFRLLIRLRVQDLAGKFELFLVSTYTAAVPAAAAPSCACCPGAASRPGWYVCSVRCTICRSSSSARLRHLLA